MQTNLFSIAVLLFLLLTACGQGPTFVVIEVMPKGFFFQKMTQDDRRRDETVHKCLDDIESQISGISKSAMIRVLAFNKESAIESFKVKNYFLEKGFKNVSVKTHESNMPESEPTITSNKELNSCGQ